jgi:lysosomal acid lipase/cholesteryl ester hydrolase
MREGLRYLLLMLGLGCAAMSAPGCATMRLNQPNADLRPCNEGFAKTADGWNLGVRHIRPLHPDQGKLPVVLCHGLGLNGTFWTITDGHLPHQLAARGYEVFVVDMRGSGASYRDGLVGRVNRGLRQTPLLELGEGSWTMDDEARYDVPAILDYVQAKTGSDRVNWVGHSLGGMLLYPFLELDPRSPRIASFVAMGATAILADVPQRDMLRANRGLRLLLRGISTGRLARPMMLGRIPGMSRIDEFYFSRQNVDRRTINRFYGYTLENPGRGALLQLDPYLEFGHLVSADRKTDYAVLLGRITTPILLVAGEGDCMSDIASTQLTLNALASSDKTMQRFGKRDGHFDDYAHCDLVWSRHAPFEVFPAVADWLDRRQPGVIGSPQSPSASEPSRRSVGEERVDADLRPGLELAPQIPQPADLDELRLRQP